jgi:hypothetical protein
MQDFVPVLFVKVSIGRSGGMASCILITRREDGGEWSTPAAGSL